MTTPRICILCTHCRREPATDDKPRWRCMVGFSPVTGRPQRCKDARAPWGVCGPHGGLWIARRPAPTPEFDDNDVFPAVITAAGAE